MTLDPNAHLQERVAEGEQGVTLLLAVLILAAMTVIVFSIATIAFNETTVSGDVIKSEPAITAAEAGAEDVLYYTERGLASVSTNCASPTSAVLANGVTLRECTNFYYPNPYTFSVPPNGERDFFLYDPISSLAAPGYANVSVYLNSGFNLTIHFCTWADPDCVNSPDIVSTTISPGTSWSSGPLTATAKYQLVLLNGTMSSNVTIDATPKAVPAGTATIETTGVNNGVTRKLQTIVP